MNGRKTFRLLVFVLLYLAFITSYFALRKSLWSLGHPRSDTSVLPNVVHDGDSSPSPQPQHSDPSLSPRFLVMSTAAGYKLEMFKQFLIPLRAYYLGDVVLFVDKPTLSNPSIVQLTTHLKVELVVLEFLDVFAHKKQDKKIKTSRFRSYTETCTGYDACLAVDFRDVYFQDDPFRSYLHHYSDCELVLTLEPSKFRYNECNSRWIRTCWGREWLEGILDETVICSGTIYGTPHGFAELTERMLREYSKTATVSGCTSNDQGHLIYLYYSGMLSDLKVCLEPPFANLVTTTTRNALRSHQLKLDRKGRLLNQDGRPASVVHQFNRYPKLVGSFKYKQYEAEVLGSW